MIAFVRGILAESWNKSCLVITSAGTGYEISLPGHTFSTLPKAGEEVAFYTSLAVREDALELFGFATFEERQTFGILTQISKVGSRTALAILTVMRPCELRQAVMEDNIPALTRVPGIGAKTAQHIFLELKYKLAQANLGQGMAKVMPQAGSSVFSDTVAALINLGYSEEECAPHARAILNAEPDLDVGSAIRLALKAMSQGKI